MFGISRYLDRYPRQLSGGERQRVALCRALVRDPKVFLLDEPLANLDAKLRNTARDELKRFQRQIRTTTVLVTHDQVEAMGLGDRIAIMDRGKVRQVGTPEEVYEDPVDTFVATFVGQPPMNLLDLGDPALPPRTLLGFRPEHFLPRSVFQPDEDVRAFRFSVRRVEYLGDRKSTRLNSSHRCISYAVFCLKKKKRTFCTFRRSLSASARHFGRSTTS